MIVKALSNHLRDIINIEKEAFENPWSHQSFLNEINNMIGSNWVYMRNTKVIGYMFGWKLDDDFHVNNIAVHLSERRKGVGKKMIDNVIFNLKIKNIFLEVSNSNKEAIRLYRKLGFREDGLRKKYYHDGSDAIFYQMEI